MKVLPPAMLKCIRDYIRADVNMEVSKACLMSYMDHWDTIRKTRVVYRGQNYPNFKKTPLISVSTQRKAAAKFATHATEGRVFTLYLHPGVRYLDFTTLYEQAGIITYTHEAEFVIPGDCEFIPRKEAPLILDVYPPLLVLSPTRSPSSPKSKEKVLLYNVRGMNKRLHAKSTRSRGGFRLSRAQTRRLRLRQRN